MSAPRVEITYCTRCKFLLRAAWMAQELLITFESELAEVALRPGSDGVFEVRLDGEVVASNKGDRKMPEPGGSDGSFATGSRPAAGSATTSPPPRV